MGILKRRNGITVIVLVITIIIMLIGSMSRMGV